MTVATILRLDLEPATQIAWVARIAAARDRGLVLLFPVQRPGDARVDEVDLTTEPEKDESGIIAAVRASIDASPDLVAYTPPKNGDDANAKAPAAETADEEPPRVSVRLRILHCPDLVATLTRTLLAEVRECKVNLICAVRRQHDVSDDELNKERRQLMRKLPCELAYFCVGNAADATCKRILVPVAHGPNARTALALANEMAGDDAKITALRVNPDVGADAHAVGAQIVDRLVRRALGRDESRVERRIEINNQPIGGIRAALEAEEYDLVIVGASKSGMMGRHLYGTVGTKLMRGGVTTPVAIVRAATPLTGRFSQLAERALQRIVPQMEREHRIDLVERIQSNSQWNFDFFALMTLSTLIAALGLVQNSAAVVIGAMLVAPLMTPLLGLGLALVQGNPVFARMALRSVALGFVVAFAVSLLVGWLSIGLGFNDPTPQIVSRGNPSMLDVGVAFAAGLAAAYAMSRPGLLAALPGVAIAAALVPPLACVGLNLAVAEFSYALGAMLLFTINVVTIVFASTLSLWAVGVRKVKRGSHWTTSGTALIVVAILALAVYVSMNPIEHGFKRELPERLPHAVRDHLHPRFTLERLQVEGGARGRELIVIVTGETIPDDAFIDSVRELVVGFFESPIRVRVVTQISSATQ